jgi:hypothetical protein
MPVVEDDGSAAVTAAADHNTKHRKHDVPDSDPIQFDYVFDGRHDPTMGNSSILRSNRRSHSPSHEAALGYTPRELDATTVVSTGTATGTTRSVGALSFITNGNQDVSYDYIERFVERIRDGVVDPLEGSAYGGSLAGTASSGTSRNRGAGGAGGATGLNAILSREQQAYLESAHDPRAKLLRLVELEESHRVDVIAAHRMNTMLFNLAAQKMVPTVRRRKSFIAPTPQQLSNKKSMRSKSFKKNRKDNDAPEAVPPVVVIHAQDIHIEFNDGAGAAGGGDEEDYFDQTIHSLAGTVQTESMSFAHTVRGAQSMRRSFAAGGGNRLGAADNVDDDERMYSPAQAPVGAAGDGAATSFSQEEENQQQCVEHFEMLALTAREVSITANVKGLVVTDSWDFLSLPNNPAVLNKGSALYKFTSKQAHHLDSDSLDMLRMFINVSSFADETVENNAPRVNCDSHDDLSKYVVILAKAMYVLPGVRLGSINKELLASLDYQRNCQAGETKFHDDVTTPFTFRQTKTIIKFLFSLVIQMKVSEITDPQILNSFKEFDGIIPAKAILLERTKKNIAKVDSTAKCKSVLLYYPINDGLLVSHATIVLNTSLPGVISKVLHTFGGQGAKENADAVRNTRRYLIHRFGDSREGLFSVL